MWLESLDTTDHTLLLSCYASVVLAFVRHRTKLVWKVRVVLLDLGSCTQGGFLSDCPSKQILFGFCFCEIFVCWVGRRKVFSFFFCGQNKQTKSWKQNRENKAPLQDLCIIFNQEFWIKRKLVIIFMLRSHFGRVPGVFSSWDLFSSKEQPRIRFIHYFFFVHHNVRTCFLIDF